MKARIRYWILRKVYEFIYWFGDTCGSESRLVYGYYRKFKHPTLVPNEDLYQEIRRLGKAIEETQD
jgi:hypothetical protein